MKRRLINAQELAEYLGLSTNTIYCWVSHRKIPFVKCGRLTKFDLRRIDEWIEENSIEVGKIPWEIDGKHEVVQHGKLIFKNGKAYGKAGREWLKRKKEVLVEQS